MSSEKKGGGGGGLLEGGAIWEEGLNRGLTVYFSIIGVQKTVLYIKDLVP